MKPRIVIAGGSGLIGTACRLHMSAEGYDVYSLTRSSKTSPGEVHWDPAKQWIAEDVINGSFAVINLCGQPLDRRWTSSYKRELYKSRIEPAQFLRKLCADAPRAPECYIGISGVGVYGDQGTRIIQGDSALKGVGFIPDLVMAWESAHHQISVARNIILRTGVVLSERGGFIERLRLPMNFRLYPYFGSGRQIMSWIHIDDVARMCIHCIRTPAIKGVYHVTAPEGIAQREMMRTLRQVRGKRGLLFPIPRFVLYLVFGEMASVLFDSVDVRPDKFILSGFQHHYPEVQLALREVLKK